MMPPPAHPTLAACGQLAMSVADSSQVGEARRAATGLAGRAGFDETRAGELAIVVTELATNLIRHGKGGELVLRVLPQCLPATNDPMAGPLPETGVEVLVLDRGPGIADVGRAMRDGFSTGGTPGTGLGAITRLASSWDLFSSPTTGTAIVVRLWRNAPAEPYAARTKDPADGQVALGVVSVPYPGELVCGDAWDVRDDVASGRTFLIVADGLGHGSAAANAASTAIASFREAAARGLEPLGIMTAVHAAMRATRGGAVAVAEINRPTRQLRYCGVGNIASTLVRGDGSTQSLVSQNGTAGAEARRIQQFVYPWDGGISQLVMHSDGLTSRWQLSQYAGLLRRSPSLIAGVLYRDHRRGRDDVTVLAVRDQLVAASATTTTTTATTRPQTTD